MALDDTNHQSAEGQAAAIASMPSMTSTERIWVYVLLNPGIIGTDVLKVAEEAGIPASSTYSLLSQLASPLKQRLLKDKTHRHPKTNQIVTAYTALGKSTDPAVQAWLDTIPGIKYTERPATGQASSPKSPTHAAKPEPGFTKTGKPRVRAINLPKFKGTGERIYWHKEEIEAICRKLVRDNVMLGHPIDAHQLRVVGRMSGLGFRPKDVTSIPWREQFLQEHKVLIMQLQLEVQQKWAAEQADAARAQAEASQQIAAPPPEPEPVHDPVEAERVAEAVAELGLEIEPEAAPEHGHSDPGVRQSIDMIISGLWGLAQSMMRDVVREELNKLPQGSATVDLTAVHDHVRSSEKRILDAFGALEADMKVQRLVRPDTSLLPKPPAPTPPYIAPPKTKMRLPVVCIVGGMSTNWEPIKKQFRDKLDLRFYSGDRTPAESDPKLIVGFANYVSHTATKLIKKRHGDKFLVIHGSSNMVVSAIASRLGIAPNFIDELSKEMT